MVGEFFPATYCFSREVKWVPYEEVQSEITEHLLAVLPCFCLRVFQRSSDLSQELGGQVDIAYGASRFAGLENPVPPNKGGSSCERDS